MGAVCRVERVWAVAAEEDGGGGWGGLCSLLADAIERGWHNRDLVRGR